MTDRPDYTACRQTDACLCPACYDRKYGAPLPEVAELADRMADFERASGFAAAEERRETALAAGPELDTCPRCGYPIVLCADGKWRHDQYGDAMACAMFYPAPRAE